MENCESATTRTAKWHDPIVVGGAVLIVLPFLVYGLFRGMIRDLRRGPTPPCKQMSGGYTDEEIVQLREAYLQKYGTLP